MIMWQKKKGTTQNVLHVDSWWNKMKMYLKCFLIQDGSCVTYISAVLLIQFPWPLTLGSQPSKVPCDINKSANNLI